MLALKIQPWQKVALEKQPWRKPAFEFLPFIQLYYVYVFNNVKLRTVAHCSNPSAVGYVFTQLDKNVIWPTGQNCFAFMLPGLRHH